MHDGSETVVGAPVGNQNAVGNSGGGAPKNNTNAQKHGAYAEHPYDELLGADNLFQELIDRTGSVKEARSFGVKIAADLLAIRFTRADDPRFAARAETVLEDCGMLPSQQIERRAQDHQ